jgi:TatD DNase family protein
MRLPLPPLDCHAHIDTSIQADDLRALRAVVVAVTREPAEWAPALDREDPETMWAVGLHPGVPAALEQFDRDRFEEALASTSFVGEIGLDGRARTHRDRQREVFDAALAAVATEPRPVTIHSVAAEEETIAMLRRHRVRAPILHWWRGDEKLTREAIELGCYFSINGHEIKKPRVLDSIPSSRLLTETDFPHSRRYDRVTDRPGRVETVEVGLEDRWGVDRLGVRRKLWQNFGAMLSEIGMAERMPRAVLAALATAGFEG